MSSSVAHLSSYSYLLTFPANSRKSLLFPKILVCSKLGNQGRTYFLDSWYLVEGTSKKKPSFHGSTQNISLRLSVSLHQMSPSRALLRTQTRVRLFLSTRQDIPTVSSVHIWHVSSIMSCLIFHNDFTCISFTHVTY